MTDSTDSADEHTSGSPHDAGSVPTTTTAAASVAAPEPVWGRLNRTNRVLTIVLGTGVAVLIVGAVFGAGVWVGAEHGGHEERGGDRDRGTSEYRGDHFDDPEEQDGPDRYVDRGDNREADASAPDTDHKDVPGQPVGPAAPSDRNIAPVPAPAPPR